MELIQVGVAALGLIGLAALFTLWRIEKRMDAIASSLGMLARQDIPKEIAEDVRLARTTLEQMNRRERV